MRVCQFRHPGKSRPNEAIGFQPRLSKV